MITRERLDHLVTMFFALMTPPPIVPIELENNNFGSNALESKCSYCQSCMNKDEGRCLSNGLTTTFPSGMCGNYEPINDLDNYNVTFGPEPEGLDAKSIPKIITMRPDLEYTEADYRLNLCSH